LIISQNWSQIKCRVKVILKLNSNKVSEPHWSTEKAHTSANCHGMGFVSCSLFSSVM